MKTLQEMIDIRLIENSILIEGVVEDGMVEKFKVLEDVHKRLFPKSWQSVYYVDSNIRVPKDTVLFRSTLKDKWSMNFKENDPQDAIFTIQHIGDEKYQATLVKGKNIRTKKSFTSNQIPFRKVKGDAQTIIKKITEWEEKRNKLFLEIKDDLD